MGRARAALALALVAPALARTLDDFLREALSSCGYGTAGCNCTDVRAENRGLDGAIPGDLEACAPSLRILSVSGNKLTGPVPPWLLRGENLWKAYLHANALSGPLPEAYGPKLEWLSLYSNALTGPLPESLGELHHLRTFAVYENKLDGTVPANLVNLSRLEYLGLNANGFAGGLPGGPYGPMLRALWLQDNDFGGALPPAIGSCPLLEILDARNGGFDGPIPEAYGRLELLRDLFLDNNAFSGTIPDAVAQLPALVMLHAANAGLAGPLPKPLFAHARLLDLDLDGNGFFGPIPNVTQPAPLRKLKLRRNALTGPLPSLSLAANLAELDVARNALVGVVPCDLLALPLASLELEGNALVGVDAGCGICDDGLTCALDGNPLQCGAVETCDDGRLPCALAGCLAMARGGGRGYFYGWRWAAALGAGVVLAGVAARLARRRRSRRPKPTDAYSPLHEYELGASVEDGKEEPPLQDLILVAIGVDRDSRITVWSRGAQDATTIKDRPKTLNDLPFRSDEDRRVALDECARVLERRAKPRPFPLVLAVDLRVVPLLVQCVPDGTGATILGNAMDLNLMSLATRPASSKASSDNAALERAASSVSGDSERAVLLANAGVRDLLRAGRGAPSLDSLGDLELSECSGRTADERPPAPLVEGVQDIPPCRAPFPSVVVLATVDGRKLRPGAAVAPHPGVSRYALPTDPASEAYAFDVGRVDAAFLPGPGVYAFAKAPGERGVRLLVPPPGAPNPAFGYGAGDAHWPPLLDGGAGAGGTLELGNEGVLLRWCVFPGHGVRDVAAAVLTAARVPLPFESLWLVAFNADTGLAAWLPDARTRAALEAAGRLQYTSDVDVVVKATSVDGAAYRAAKRSLVRARDAQRGLAAATEAVRRRARDVRAARAAGRSEDAEADARAAMDALICAQATYARLKADIRADGAVQTYALGRRERAARRRLGLLDERALRHGARLRLVHIGHRDDGSPLSRVAEDVVNIVVAFLGSPADAGHGGLAPPPPPRRF